jgi:prepilin-type N-terminal cleavage/methylation domain-containing protein
MNYQRSNAGFSLLEVMIAVLILGIALVGLTQGISTALSSGKESELQTTAALFAAGKIEKLRADLGLKDEQTEGACGDTLPLYQWKQSVTPTRIEGLHEVVVVVESSRTGRAIYELRTLLFERPDDPAPRSGNRRSTRSQGGQR